MGKNDWPSRKLGNGVHALVSRLPWVWRRGVPSKPFGPEFGWHHASGKPLRGKATSRPAVPSEPQAAGQQKCPGPERCLGPPGGVLDVVAAYSQAPESPPAINPAPYMYGRCPGPPGGAGEVVAACSQAPKSPPAMCPAPFMYGLGGRLALEMARGRRKELAKWLRHILRPQYPRLLCIRLRSCMASIAAWPWKWPGGVERGWRCGCGLFSGPNIAACYVSGSVHVWPR